MRVVFEGGFLFGSGLQARFRCLFVMFAIAQTDLLAADVIIEAISNCQKIGMQKFKLNLSVHKGRILLNTLFLVFNAES